MSNQILISSGAKLRDLDDVIIGTDGILSSLGFDVPYGVPRLDGNGKILASELPNSVMEFKGVWNAATNTPTLTNGVGNAGDVYLCNVAGTVDFGAGPITFAVGDYAVYTGSVWARSSGAVGTVTSVAVSRSGDALAITGSPITTSGTINIGFTGNSSQYINGAGNLVNFPTIAPEATRLITEVYNETGATLTKGTIVYINGGHGNLPTVTKAIATGDATSAQTYGVVQSDITTNNNGYVVVIGSLNDLDTSAYTAGTQLYLSGTTAGAWTSTKPSAPIHLVYIGIVVRSHPTQGVVEIRIQNGYELEELHNVQIVDVANNDGIFYDSATSLWKNKTIAEVLGYTPANAATTLTINGTTYDLSANRTWNVGTVTSVGLSAPTGFSVTGSPVTSSGTLALSFAAGYSLPTNIKQSNWDDAYTWVAAFPTQTGNAGKFLTTDGSSLSWATNPLGTVTSVAMSVPTGLSVAGSPITTSGTLAVTFAAGYSIPTNASQTNWDTAYTNRITSLTTTGSSGAATLISNTLNIPNYTLAGLGGVPTSRTLTINGVTYDLSADRTWTITAGISSVSGTAPISVSTVSGAATVSISQATTSTNGYLSSTDWNTFNGKQNALTLTTTGSSGAATLVGATLNIPQYQSVLTNPVTGTGTTNYVTKWTSGSAVGNSIIYDSGTTIGILTSNPRDTFVVSGNGAIVSERFSGANPYSGDLYFYSSRGSSSSPTVKVNNDLLMGIRARGFDGTNYIEAANIESYVSGTPSTNVMYGNIAFSTNNGAASTSIKMVLASSGNLLIGTTTDSGYKLDVSGTGRFTNSVQVNTGSNEVTPLIITAPNALTAPAFSIRQTNSSIQGYDFDTENVLVGRLDLYGVTSTGRVLMTSWSKSTGNFLVGTTTDAGYKVNISGTLRSSGNSYLATTTTGVLAIGTTSVVSSGTSNILQIGTRGVIQNVVGNQMMISNNAYYDGAWKYITTDTAQAIRFGAQLSGDISFHVAPSGTAGSTMANWDDSNIRMYISPTGNVGVGTKTPEAIFTITKTNGNYTSSSAGFIVLNNLDALGQSAIYYTYNGTMKGKLRSDYVGNLNYVTNGGDHTFFVGGDAGTGSVKLLVTNSGPVYINNTTGISGGGALQVNGDVNINGNFKINGTTIGGGGGSGVTGSGTANYVTKWTGSSTLGNSLLYDNGSYLSVTTSDLRFGTDLAGANTAIIKWQGSTANIPNSLGLFTWGDAKDIQIGGANVYFRSESGTQRVLISSSGAMQASGNGSFGLASSATQYTSISENQIWRTGGGDFYVNWSGTGKTILGSSTTGNVLIGTTTDNGYKLQINGSVSFAYGYLSIYRGSSSPNDILVGNDGSRFYIGGNAYSSGSVTATGFFESSDSRLKKLLIDNYNAAGIENVKAKLYIKDGKEELGYFAQDLEKVLKSSLEINLSGYYDLSYRQVHTAKISYLENKIKELEEKLNSK